MLIELIFRHYLGTLDGYDSQIPASLIFHHMLKNFPVMLGKEDCKPTLYYGEAQEIPE